METARDQLTEAMQRVEAAINEAESALGEASDELHRLRMLIVPNGDAPDPDAPNPTVERRRLAEWNRMAGRTEATR
ncbi:MAG: hypothetical protein M3Y58_12320 [Chloroflexota bacterium]|nr:hypothetical protein [Chloroflexota bacterium]